MYLRTVQRTACRLALCTEENCYGGVPIGRLLLGQRQAREAVRGSSFVRFSDLNRKCSAVPAGLAKLRILELV